MQYINVGVEQNLQRSRIVEEGILLQFASYLVPVAKGVVFLGKK